MEYGCIGEHLSHSFSKEIHAHFADYEYNLCELALGELDEFFRVKNFKAINVTIPYKQSVIKYLDWIDPAAKKIGAVNTVVNKNGKLYGYNTDFLGLKALITSNDVVIKDKKVLILGGGGTSKTAKAVCEHLSASQIICVSRSCNDGFSSYDDAYKDHTDAAVIINTTPCGMYPSCEGMAIDPTCFPKLEAAVDVVYNPLKTDFLEAAEKSGAKICGGLYMLVAQAAFAVEKFIDIAIASDEIDSVYNKILLSKQNIVLVGMPASGKTTNGKRIAEYLSRQFYDSDAVIEKNENLAIRGIFAKYGESHFRALETATIKELSKLSGVIIATGGGAVLNSENVRWLKKNGKVYFIDRPLEQLCCTESRPLSSRQSDLERLYEVRRPIYLDCADHILKSDNTFKELKEMF